MDKMMRQSIFQEAKEMVLEAGRFIREKIDQPLDVQTKTNPNDLVTEMDRATEDFLVSKIRHIYPKHLILGEEGFGDDIHYLRGIVWFIDPIDGTTNFVHQKSNFAISIGIYEDGIGEIGIIYDVMSDVLYYGIKGEGAYRNGLRMQSLKEKTRTLDEAILAMNPLWLSTNRLVDKTVMEKLAKKVRALRTYGVASLEFAYVAEGKLDAYLALNLEPWDVAAGIIIVNEVHGITTTIDGNLVPMLQKNPIITCHPAIQEEIIQSYIAKGRK